MTSEGEPTIAFGRDLLRAVASSRSFDGIVDRFAERGSKIIQVSGLYEPPSLAVGDDLARTEAVHGHDGHAACHGFDENLTKLLPDRREREHVGRRQKIGQLSMVAPARQEDPAHPKPCNRVRRVLALPLAGMAANNHEDGGGARTVASASEGFDEQRELLDLREPACGQDCYSVCE